MISCGQSKLTSKFAGNSMPGSITAEGIHEQVVFAFPNASVKEAIKIAMIQTATQTVRDGLDLVAGNYLKANVVSSKALFAPSWCKLPGQSACTASSPNPIFLSPSLRCLSGSVQWCEIHSEDPAAEIAVGKSRMCYSSPVTWEQIIGLSLALLVMLVALVGNVVPGIPGTPLALIAAIGHRLYFGQTSINNIVLIVLILLTVVALVLDYLGSALGAKKFGATWRGMVGAVVGGIIGLFLGLPGIILGPFVGATLFEMLGDKEFKNAAKAGTGAVIGLALGAIGKSALCVVMIALFAVNVIARSVN